MRAIVIANGEFADFQETRDLIHPGDWIIAADGGARQALSVGLTPHLVIGDLDSLSPADQAALEKAGSKFLRFSPRKDETDLELAIRHAVREGATEVVILAATGGRLDHTIANVLLLTLPMLKGVNARIVVGRQTAFVVRDEMWIEGNPGDTLSLIPLGGDVLGVTAENVEWPLHSETLRLGPSRGLSNVLTADRARVSVRRGALLCVVTRKPKE